MKRYDSGVRGEALAGRFLAGKGMRPLDSRYRAADGELDLIMEDGGTIVFVEVKYRPAARAGAGIAAVTPDKQRRMAHAAAEWMLEHEDGGRPCRFDVVEITSDGVRHVENAFSL